MTNCIQIQTPLWCVPLCVSKLRIKMYTNAMFTFLSLYTTDQSINNVYDMNLIYEYIPVMFRYIKVPLFAIVLYSFIVFVAEISMQIYTPKLLCSQ